MVLRTVTDYCNQNNPTTKERLDLFILVCPAIPRAHEKGIIHRDIKPSNILFTLHDGVPVHKVVAARACPSRLRRQRGAHQFLVIAGKDMAIRVGRRGPCKLSSPKN